MSPFQEYAYIWFKRKVRTSNSSRAACCELVARWSSAPLLLPILVMMTPALLDAALSPQNPQFLLQ